MEKKGTLRQKRRPKGDPNPQKGPLGDPGPLKGTHWGTVQLAGGSAYILQLGCDRAVDFFPQQVLERIVCLPSLFTSQDQTTIESEMRLVMQQMQR